jgi:hypothetical protein
MKSFGKILLSACLFFAVLFCLCGCKVRKASSLKNEARLTYGPAKLVSTYKGQDETTVVLRDKLQGFEYTMTSSLHNLSIDGSSFGNYEHTYSDFELKLQDYVVSEVRDDLNKLCTQYHASWSRPTYFTKDVMLYLTVDDPADAQPLAEDVANLIQPYNLENRLDNDVIYVQDTNEDTLGQVTLPGCTYVPESNMP